MKEYGEMYNKFSSKVPYFLLLENDIILNKNGTLQKTIEVRGIDLETQTDETIISYNSSLNNILKRLEDGITLHIDTIREKSENYIKSFGDTLFNLIENEREEFFNKGNYFENRTYITFTYTVPLDQTHKMEKYFINNKEDKFKDEYIKNFKKYFYEIFDLFKGVFLEAKELSGEETLTYLHSLISINKQNVTVPDIPIYLSNYLCDCTLIGGLQLRLESHNESEFISIVSISGFPHKTLPCFFDKLNQLDIDYRWNIRYRALEKQKALKKLHTAWSNYFKARHTLWQMACAEISGSPPVTENETALENADEIKVQQNLVESDILSQGHYINLIILRDKDIKKLESKVRQINAFIQKLGFTTIVETYNALYAYIGSLPGEIYHNERDYIIQNSITVSHLFPLSNIWAGSSINKHLNASALLSCQTGKSTPFKLNLHVNQVGHTAILGRTGGGKSVLLSTLACNYKKYNSNIYFFDKDKSSLVLTYATANSKFYNLGIDDIGFQPLRNIDNPVEMEWARDFILDILELENIQITPSIKTSVWNTLILLSKVPLESRTMTNFVSLINVKNIKETLLPFTGKGALGRYFDSNHDSLNLTKWVVFEMAKIIDNKQALPHFLSYIFHKIEIGLDGTPTMIILDECWMFLDNEKFSKKIKDWLKTFRKKNAILVFATQELSDVKKSKIYDTIREACVSKIYLANKEANSEANKHLYTEFGLNEKEINILTQMTERKDYYLKQEKGARYFDLALSPTELKFITKTDIESQNKAIDIYNQVKGVSDEFIKLWLKEA